MEKIAGLLPVCMIVMPSGFNGATRLGSLLATRRFASRWAVALAVMGASILVLTLTGLPEDGVTTTIHTEADRPI
jgi:hypothetical protein